MLPPAYTKAILRDYHQKKEFDVLPFDMKQLSPASFKGACLEVCRDKYDKKDGPLLRAFFEEGSDQGSFLKAIHACKIDRFRPLVSFVKKRTFNPDDKVVEIVAWMIGFKDRPYNPQIDYTKISEEVPDKRQDPPIKPTSTNEEKDGSERTTVEIVTDKRKSKKIKIVITILVILGMVTYLVWSNKPAPAISTSTGSGSQACMYWADDHYQPVNCNQKIENVQVIALDPEMVLHFRKIMRPDTITISAKGSVWYVRYRGNYEYYTDSGYHPLDPELRLRPITENIINHHVPANP